MTATTATPAARPTRPCSGRCSTGTGFRGLRPRRAAGRAAGGGGCSLMARLDKKTTNDLIKLVIFLLVTTLATSLLVITIGNISFSGTKEYKAQFADATGVVKGDDIRIAGVKVGTVKKVEIVDETRALVTFSVEDEHAAQRLDPRLDPLPQPGRPALHLADPGRRRHRRARRRRDDPGRPHLAGARPDRAVQRLQAAVPGALARRHQQAVLRDRPGLPGRGRHPREPPGPHRLDHPDAGRPRRRDRRPDRQPRLRAPARGRPRRPAEQPDHQLPRPDHAA